MSIKKLNILKFYLWLLVVELGTAEVLNCENLDALQCKNEFSKQFDDIILPVYSKQGERILDRYGDEWSKTLKEFDQNDPIIAYINLQTQIYDNMLDFLRHGHTLIELSKDDELRQSLKDANLSVLKLDKESETRAKELSSKVKKTVDKIEAQELPKRFASVIKSWSQLYEGLRKTDFFPYPEYKELNEIAIKIEEDLAKGNPSIISNIKSFTEQAASFLNLQNLKTILPEDMKKE